MTIAGIIGGIGPESTIDYYRKLSAVYRERRKGEAPAIVITSIDVTKLRLMIESGRLEAVVDYLDGEVRRLAAAGASFAAIAANTPHLVFDDLSQRAVLPLIRE